LCLSTCNRVEFLVVLDKSCEEDFLIQFKAFIERETGLSWARLSSFFYILTDEEAIRHLFKVACGLDSMVLGEPQILGQLKEAYKKSLEHRLAKLFLNKLLHRAFFVAKRVRTETGIGGGALSVSYAATKLAKKILGSLKDKVVLLIGAGEMAEIACQHLLTFGAKEILIANRTLSKAIELSKKFKGKPYPLEDLPELLIKSDIVISSTGAPSFIITKNLLSSLLRARKYKPLFLIDIAVPRDIEPRVNELENIYLFDIDDLQGVIEENLKNRKKEALRAEAIVEEEVHKMKKWLQELSLHPTIHRLVEKAEELRKRELEITLKKLKNLTEEEKKTIDFLTYSLMMKWLSHPIQFLKKGYHEDGKYAISLIREIFNLDEMKGEIDREKELEESLELTEASSEKDLKKEYPLH
ncbi:MAG: glutamyl-tRNA reductase, partial [Thermodesulfobacteriaceae bacterium]|nr:glutamyl-tRNA reductase [Thermodesulfobacteriaceae bacterium]